MLTLNIDFLKFRLMTVFIEVTEKLNNLYTSCISKMLSVLTGVL